jgi:hypothetical protein
MYLLDDEKLDRVIASVREILGKNGLFACGTLCHRSVPDPVMDAFYPAIAKKIAPYTPYPRLNTEYEKALRKHGFSVEPGRIRVSDEEYVARFKERPPEEFWFEDDASRRVFYTEYGKDVWLCTPE